MKGLKSHKHAGFSHNALNTKKEPHAVHYLKQRTSFWVAVMSLFTFVIGNMMGQHGWYAFWASVLGGEDDSIIAYVGAGLPVAQVVDYGCWAKYGGNHKIHTYRQAPEECKKSLPRYTSSPNRDELYSMQYMSSYTKTTEGTGHHSGIDIRIPVGTPILATMTGRVHKVGDQPRGFGKYVVLEHPNVPDPSNPNGSTTKLFTNYGHLSSILVEPGDIVRKGETVAYSGNTGFSTGPHLDFMVIRDGAPFLPFYPSNSDEGYQYTVNPMLYVQSNYAAPTTVVASETVRKASAPPQEVVAPRRAEQVQNTERRVATPDPEVSRKTVIARLQSRREARIRSRLNRRNSRKAVVASRSPLTTGVSAQVEAPPPPETQVATHTEVITNKTAKVASVQIEHDGYFKGPRWEKIRVILLDEEGERVTNPLLDKDITIRVAYGKGTVRPATLSPLDFMNGEGVVHVLPQARSPLVLTAFPFSVLSQPMKFAR